MSLLVLCTCLLLFLALGIAPFLKRSLHEAKLARAKRDQTEREQRNQERLDLIEFWFAAGKREGLKQESARHQQELFDLLVDGANLIVDAQSGRKKSGR